MSFVCDFCDVSDEIIIMYSSSFLHENAYSILAGEMMAMDARW